MSEKPLRNNTAKFYIHKSTQFSFANLNYCRDFDYLWHFSLGAIEKFVFLHFYPVYVIFVHRNIVYSIVPLYRSTLYLYRASTYLRLLLCDARIPATEFH